MATEAGAEVLRATARAEPDQLGSPDGAVTVTIKGHSTRPQCRQASQILTGDLMFATRMPGDTSPHDQEGSSAKSSPTAPLTDDGGFQLRIKQFDQFEKQAL